MIFCIVILIKAPLSPALQLGREGPDEPDKRLENRKPGGKGRKPDTGRHGGIGSTHFWWLGIRTASKAVNPDNLQTNSATVSEESPQESYHKNNEKPLVFGLFWESAICRIAEGRIWQHSRQPDNLQTNSATVSEESP